MSDDSQGYNIAVVRRLLKKAFSPEEMIQFCMDRPAFQEVVNDFGLGMGLNDMVAKVIGYCSRRRMWDDLLAGVQQEREVAYAEFEPQLRAPGVPLPAAPVISTPFNLPADLADFTGRGGEAAELRQRLTDGGVVAIAGMGGIGKTALAVHVARGLVAAGRFKDAQLFIDLKGTGPQPLSPTAVLGALLGAVAGPNPRRPAEEAALAGLWRAAIQGKDAVLILDNAAGAVQVRPLLPGCPSYAVVVTSRQRFTLPGAGLIDVERLPTAKARALLQVLAPRLDEAGADEIAELCGGLPMALRIAGNYLALNDDCPVREYAERLAGERALAQLREPDSPNLDVAAAIGLSVEQLDGEARRAWALLGLFPAPFDAGAVGAVWDVDDLATLDRLRALRNRSLVSYDDESGRYDLHDLLRLAARRDLGEEEMDATRERLARHYLGVARVAVEAQRYPALDADWPHLRVALEYAAGRNVGLLSDLVYALNGYWSVRGMARDRATWCQRAAEACAAAGRRRDEGNHLGDLGNAYADLGEAQRTIGYYEQALTIHREVGDQQGEGADLGSLGLAYAALGEPQRAIGYYEQALAIDRKVRNRQGEGNHLGGLGLAYADLGEAQKAISCCKQALDIHHDIGDRRGEGNDLCTLGDAYTKLREVQRAISYYERALAIHRDIGDRRGEGADLGKLGLSYKELGEMAHAREVWAEALRIFEEIEAPQAEWVRGLLAEHDTDSHG